MQVHQESMQMEREYAECGREEEEEGAVRQRDRQVWCRVGGEAETKEAHVWGRSWRSRRRRRHFYIITRKYGYEKVRNKSEQ